MLGKKQGYFMCFSVESQLKEKVKAIFTGS